MIVDVRFAVRVSDFLSLNLWGLFDQKTGLINLHGDFGWATGRLETGWCATFQMIEKIIIINDTHFLNL